MQWPLIARGSNAADWKWCTDVFSTVHDINTPDQLVEAINKIRADGNNSLVREHCENRGIIYDFRVHVLVQEQCPSETVGYIMRHPNNPYKILMEWTNPREKNLDYKWSLSANVYFWKNGRIDWDISSYPSRECQKIKGHPLSIEKAHLEKALEYYLKVEKVFGGEENALLMECSLDPFWCYQIKQFKPIDGIEFKSPKLDENIPRIIGAIVFGRTPEQGLVVPMVAQNFYTPNKPAPRFGLFNCQKALYHPLGLGQRYDYQALQIFASKFLCEEGVDGWDHKILNHGIFRMLQAADISFVYLIYKQGKKLISSPFLKENDLIEFNGDCRVFACGGQGLIVPEKYMSQVKRE